MKKIKIGILGIGKMGEAIAEGLSHTGQFEIRATTKSKEAAREISKRMKIDCGADNAKLAAFSEVLVLCVKPHQAKEVLAPLKSKMKGKLLISVCASLTCDELKKWSGGKAAVIRSMPNTPCLVNEGMTVFAPGVHAGEKEIALAERIFATVGKTAVVEESLMDGVTGLSGCGPAYMFMILESLSEAGVKVGLQRKTATLLAAQTMLGASRMALIRNEHPAALKDEVTTPAGCTVDGLMALEDGGLRSTLIKAVVAATKRSATLGKK